MGSVVKLHNHVVLDQELISRVWAVANFLRKDGGTAPAMREIAEELAEVIAVHDDLLDEWASPIRERMIPVPQGEQYDG